MSKNQRVLHCADYATPLYPQKLALTSPTSGGRLVGIVRLRTKATEFSLVYMFWPLQDILRSFLEAIPPGTDPFLGYTVHYFKLCYVNISFKIFNTLPAILMSNFNILLCG
jgi:hypothetical protein